MGGGITLDHFLVLGLILFLLGSYCVLTRRNAIGILMGIELIYRGATEFDEPASSWYLRQARLRSCGTPPGLVGTWKNCSNKRSCKSYSQARRFWSRNCVCPIAC